MAIDTKLISQLRSKTGAGIMDCKKALTETNGDIDKSIDYLRKHGLQKAGKKSDRVAGEGLIASYLHSNKKIASLVQLQCETDFVARNQDFVDFANDLAMHVVASNPSYISIEDVPQDAIDREKGIYKEQLAKEGKPEEIMDKIIEGKLNKYYEDVCLLEQSFIKDEDRKVKDMISEKIATIGEKIEITRFVRFEI